MARWKRDVLYGTVFLLFCIVNYIYAGSIKQSAIEITLARPDIYLKLWLIIFGVLSAIMIIKAVINKSQEALAPIFQKLIVITILLFALYLFVLPYVGFTISTAAFLSILLILYGLEGNERAGKEFVKAIITWTLIAVIVTVLTELLFRNVLYVRLPVFNLF